MKDSTKIKQVYDLFQAAFSRLILDYPIPEDIVADDIFRKEQISILVLEVYLCYSEPS